MSVAVAISLALAMAALTATATAGAATGDGGGSSRADEQSLSIWAYFDGDTPVSGGEVRAYADGRRLRERGDGPGPVTTFPGGMAMLRFNSLPSALRIVVSGGRAGGERVDGSLRTKVRDVTDGEIIHVNPVTTVSDLLAHREDGPGLRHPRDLTERTLGIRPVLDDHDLWATDRWFEGDRFLRWAMERGSVGAGARDLVHLIERPGFDRRQFDPPDAGGPKAHGAGSGGPSAGNVLHGLVAAAACGGAIANDVIGGMADAAAAGVAAGLTLTGPQGFLLAAGVLVFKQLFTHSIGDCGDKNAGEDEISAQLRAISAQIAQLKAHIDDKFLNLRVGSVGATIRTIRNTQDKFREMVTYVKAMEKALSPPKPGDPPDKDRCTSTTCMQAKANLVDATSKFLTGARGLAGTKDNAASTLDTAIADQTTPSKVPGLISDVRESIGHGRFFTSEDSEQIRSFFQYYEWAQIELATVLIEYDLLGGDCAQKFSELNPADLLTGKDWKCKSLPEPAANAVKQIKENMEHQRTMLPPRVLDKHVFIDRDTHLMWRREPEVRGVCGALCERPGASPGILEWGLQCVSKPPPGEGGYLMCGASTVAPQRTFYDGPAYPAPLWDIPTAPEYRALFAGRGPSAEPLERLRNLGVSPSEGFFRGDPAGYLWLKGDFYVFGDDKSSQRNILLKALLYELRPGGPTRPNSKEFELGNRCYANPDGNWWHGVHPDCRSSWFPKSGWNESLRAYIIWRRGPMSDAEGGDYWCKPATTKSWDPAQC